MCKFIRNRFKNGRFSSEMQQTCLNPASKKKICDCFCQKSALKVPYLCRRSALKAQKLMMRLFLGQDRLFCRDCLTTDIKTLSAVFIAP